MQSTRDVPKLRHRHAIRRRVPLLVALLALAALATPAHAGSLNLIVAGPGAVTLDPPGVHLGFDGAPDGKTTCDKRQLASGATQPCLFTYPAGTMVTLTAVPDATPTAGGLIPSFARWSSLACLAATQCRVAIGDAADTVAATFNPLSVKVAPTGPGSISSQPAGISDCNADSPAQACTLEVAAGTPVTLTATSSASVSWPLGCDATTATTCSTAATSDPWWVFPQFGPSAPETGNRPPRVKVRFSVKKAGSGTGSVKAARIDCGSTCSAEYDEFGQRVRLDAAPAAGSTFGGWQGTCGQGTVCVVPVGVIGDIRAVFDRKPQPPKLVVSAVSASASGRRAGRRIAVRVTVNRSTAAAVQLTRGTRVLARRNYGLRPGANLLRLRVPRQVKRGRARVVLRIVGAKVITRNVQLAR